MSTQDSQFLLSAVGIGKHAAAQQGLMNYVA